MEVNFKNTYVLSPCEDGSKEYGIRDEFISDIKSDKELSMFWVSFKIKNDDDNKDIYIVKTDKLYDNKYIIDLSITGLNDASYFNLDNYPILWFYYRTSEYTRITDDNLYKYDPSIGAIGRYTVTSDDRSIPGYENGKYLKYGNEYKPIDSQHRYKNVSDYYIQDSLGGFLRIDEFKVAFKIRIDDSDELNHVMAFDYVRNLIVIDLSTYYPIFKFVPSYTYEYINESGVELDSRLSVPIYQHYHKLDKDFAFKNGSNYFAQSDEGNYLKVGNNYLKLSDYEEYMKIGNVYDVTNSGKYRNGYYIKYGSSYPQLLAANRYELNATNAIDGSVIIKERKSSRLNNYDIIPGYTGSYPLLDTKYNHKSSTSKYQRIKDAAANSLIYNDSNKFHVFDNTDSSGINNVIVTYYERILEKFNLLISDVDYESLNILGLRELNGISTDPIPNRFIYNESTGTYERNISGGFVRFGVIYINVGVDILNKLHSGATLSSEERKINLFDFCNEIDLINDVDKYLQDVKITYNSSNDRVKNKESEFTSLLFNNGGK